MNSSAVREIPANELSIDLRVQRELDYRRVSKVAANWNDLMVGVLTVSERADGTKVVLDGQTRLMALRLVCGDPETNSPVLVQVHTGLTLQEEAAIFLEHNDRKSVTPLDRFRIALVAQEQWALDIADIAAVHGWYVQGAPVPEEVFGKARRFSAITAAEKIYKLDEGESLNRVFDTIVNAWPKESGTVGTETLNGFGLMYFRHPTLDHYGLTQKLGKLGFNRFVSGVHDHRRGNVGTSIAQAAYTHTLDIYNLGRRTRRIDS
jgi:hypothetical protein